MPTIASGSKDCFVRFIPAFLCCKIELQPVAATSAFAALNRSGSAI